MTDPTGPAMPPGQDPSGFSPPIRSRETDFGTLVEWADGVERPVAVYPFGRGRVFTEAAPYEPE